MNINKINENTENFNKSNGEIEELSEKEYEERMESLRELELNKYFVEISFMYSPQSMIIVREESSGKALIRALNEYDPYLLNDVIGIKITYIEEK